MSEVDQSQNPELDETLDERRPKGWNRLLLFVSAIIVGGFLLVVTGATLYTWATKISWSGSTQHTKTDFPIKGENLTIANIKTNFTKYEGQYVPSAQIRLGKKSTNGRLRCLLRTNEDKVSGSPLALDFKDGQFESGRFLSFSATEGIQSEGMLHAYLSELSPPWFLVISEGPTGSTSTEDFKEVARIPIARKFTLK